MKPTRLLHYRPCDTGIFLRGSTRASRVVVGALADHVPVSGALTEERSKEAVGAGADRNTRGRVCSPRHFMRPALACLMCWLMCLTAVRATQEQRFASSEDALKAFTTAAVNKDTTALDLLFGPALKGLVSADPVQASNGLAGFSRRVAQKVTLVKKTESLYALEIGSDAWPFPIPLAQQGGQWFFDTEAGREEILNRRIGRNELDTIRVCCAYVEAQREYASQDHTGSGVLEYAQHLRSSPGHHDGLYWHAEPGDEISPLGPMIAQAVGEGYTHESKIMNGSESPYHGYLFKILTRQGKNAPGEKYNYIINGHMIAGFALVAWPAEWDNSGVMTFIVNQQGKVYERNLGPKTAAIAGGMTTFDPGPGWKATDL